MDFQLTCVVLWAELSFEIMFYKSGLKVNTSSQPKICLSLRRNPETLHYIGVICVSFSTLCVCAFVWTLLIASSSKSSLVFTHSLSSFWVPTMSWLLWWALGMMKVFLPSRNSSKKEDMSMSVCNMMLELNSGKFGVFYCHKEKELSSYPDENGRRERTGFITEVALEQILKIVDWLTQQRNSHHWP